MRSRARATTPPHPRKTTSSLRFRYQTIEFGDLDIHVRTLRDTLQYLDDEGIAEALGISSAAWPLFGVVWPAGQALAHLMFDYDVAGKRVLEVGCGIGLASLVLNHRAADITATDLHPEAEGFLRHNAKLNGGPMIPFVRSGWADATCDLGDFDLIIGSDLLYERDQVQLLSAFVERHARASCEVIIVDPGRGEIGHFSKAMAGFGYVLRRHAAEGVAHLVPAFTAQVLHYAR